MVDEISRKIEERWRGQIVQTAQIALGKRTYNMVGILQIILLCIAGFFSTYLLLLSIVARSAKRTTSFRVEKQRRFAIVTPAHNEESAILRTLESFFRIDYPPELRDIIVVADNCTDDTARIAREAGAIVYERHHHDLRGKGYALRWVFDRFGEEKAGYDAVVVIDADSVASVEFLSVMNYYLAKGARALQSSDLVMPQPGVWSVEATRLGFTLYNYVRPLGRRVLGGHAGARGNGMCFAWSALERVPWNAFSQNEDLEYGLQLLLSGIPVEFAPEAEVLATMPAVAKNAESQRSRWEAGRFMMIRKYSWPLLKAFFGRRSFAFFDAFVDLTMPPLVNFIILCAGLGIASGVVALTGLVHPVFPLLWFIVTLCAVLHMIIGLQAPGVDPSLRTTLVHIPRYAWWKLLLYLRLVRRGHTREWVRTTREDRSPEVTDFSKE
jgi:1,2-diacylglycerol 3-beta-glucosyltransferase